MNFEPIGLIPIKTIEEIESDLVTAGVLALRRLGKIVTAKTAKSLRAESTVKKNKIDFALYGSGGIKYIMQGKPANTKLPVKKVGGKFELIQSIKDWKAVVGFGGSDFLLARAIARNKQEPKDVGGLTLEIYEKNYSDKISQQLFSIYAKAVGKELIQINGTPNN